MSKNLMFEEDQIYNHRGTADTLIHTKEVYLYAHAHTCLNRRKRPAVSSTVKGYSGSWSWFLPSPYPAGNVKVKYP